MKKSGKMKPDRDVTLSLPARTLKPIRVRRMARFYKNYLKENAKVLDIGCGNGLSTFLLQQILDINLNLLGVDVIPSNPPFDFQLVGDKLPFRDREFDVSMLNGVLHHCPYENQLRLIEEALRVSNRVLIEEYPGTFIMKLVDIIMNKVARTGAGLIFTFRNLPDWIQLFGDFNFEYKTYKKVPLFPIDIYLFMLERK